MWHVWGNIQRLSNTKRGIFGTIQAKAGSGAGGAGGTRTPDPLNAIEVLSLLSYSPTAPISKIVAGRQPSDAGCPDPATVTRTTVQLLRFTEDSACCPPLSVAESRLAITTEAYTASQRRNRPPP